MSVNGIDEVYICVFLLKSVSIHFQNIKPSILKISDDKMILCVGTTGSGKLNKPGPENRRIYGC